MPPRQRYVRSKPATPSVKPLSEGFARPPQASSSQASSSGNIVPARSDGTEVAAYTRGNKRLALHIAADPEALAAARGELEGKVYSASNKDPRSHKLQTWIDVAHAAGYKDPVTLDPSLLYDASAALWKHGIGPWTATSELPGKK